MSLYKCNVQAIKKVIVTNRTTRKINFRWLKVKEFTSSRHTPHDHFLFRLMIQLYAFTNSRVYKICDTSVNLWKMCAELPASKSLFYIWGGVTTLKIKIWICLAQLDSLLQIYSLSFFNTQHTPNSSQNSHSMFTTLCIIQLENTRKCLKISLWCKYNYYVIIVARPSSKRF